MDFSISAVVFDTAYAETPPIPLCHTDSTGPHLIVPSPGHAARFFCHVPSVFSLLASRPASDAAIGVTVVVRLHLQNTKVPEVVTGKLAFSRKAR